jgi:ribonuclease HI
MPDDRPDVTIYTDGGADPNPGPGGWGVVLIHDATRAAKELSGSEEHTTNNRMELTAAIRALEALKQPCRVHLFTDSEYLRLGITEWLPDWIARGWRRKGGEVQNADLWQRLAALTDQHEITWEWVRGHAGHRYNERADHLASQAIRAHYATGAVEGPAAEVFLLVSARGKQGWWGAMIHSEEGEQIIHGHETGITSNRLDLLAALQALSRLPEGISVRVYTRSGYLRQGATQWIEGWKRRGWQTKNGQPVKNRDLWEQLDVQIRHRQVAWPLVDDDMMFEFEDLAERLREEIADRQRGWQDDDSYDA